MQEVSGSIPLGSTNFPLRIIRRIGASRDDRVRPESWATAAKRPITNQNAPMLH